MHFLQPRVESLIDVLKFPFSPLVFRETQGRENIFLLEFGVIVGQFAVRYTHPQILNLLTRMQIKNKTRPVGATSLPSRLPSTLLLHVPAHLLHLLLLESLDFLEFLTGIT